jgi:hypothetical protein
MNTDQNQVLVALRRAIAFLDTHDDQLGDINRSTARRNLDAAAEKLAAFAAEQQKGQLARTAESAARKILLENLHGIHMRAIAILARQLVRDEVDRGRLRMLPVTFALDKVLAHARVMADTAEQHAALFIEHGLAESFVAELREAIVAVERSRDELNTLTAAMMGATCGLEQQERAGRAMLAILDVLFRRRFGDAHPLIGEWRVARSIGDPPRTPTRKPRRTGRRTDSMRKEVECSPS